MQILTLVPVLTVFGDEVLTKDLAFVVFDKVRNYGVVVILNVRKHLFGDLLDRAFAATLSGAN